MDHAKREAQDLLEHAELCWAHLREDIRLAVGEAKEAYLSSEPPAARGSLPDVDIPFDCPREQECQTQRPFWGQVQVSPASFVAELDAVDAATTAATKAQIWRFWMRLFATGQAGMMLNEARSATLQVRGWGLLEVKRG